MSIDKTFLRLEQVKQNLSSKYQINMEQIITQYKPYLHNSYYIPYMLYDRLLKFFPSKYLNNGQIIYSFFVELYRLYMPKFRINSKFYFKM
mgnify:CR=1 FL=1